MSLSVRRLAYLCSDPGIPPDGAKGASVHFREMARALSAAGVVIDALMARPRCGQVAGGLDCRVLAPDRARGPRDELNRLAHAAVMARSLEEAGPHDAVYERFSLFGVAGMAYAHRAGIPLILEVNAPLWLEQARYRTLHLERGARALASDVMHAAAHVLVVSRRLREIVVNEGVDPARVHVVHNGVDRAAFEAARPAARPEPLRQGPMMVFVGSLKPWHGIEFLLEAVARCQPRVGLWVVGDGPLRDLVAVAAARDPEHIVLEGAVPHAQIPAVLAAADLAVAPYMPDAPDYFCPLKVVEAIAAGCPLLAANTPSVVEVAGDAGTVELFRPGDFGDFERALRALLEGAPRAPRQPARVPAALGWDGNARRILELLDWGAAPAVIATPAHRQEGS